MMLGTTNIKNNLEERIISCSWNEYLCMANQEDFLVAQMYKTYF